MQKQKKQNYGKEVSRVKLMVYDKGNNPLVFFSFLHDDRRGREYTINAMKERILKKHLRFQFNRAIFYDTANDSEISQVTTADFNKSTVKLVVFDSENRCHEHYSLASEEHGTEDFTIGVMNHRILIMKYGNRFNAAIFYDVKTGQELRRFYAYGRIKAPIQEEAIV